jgi:formamidopyrimidine-DNA glycosylase
MPELPEVETIRRFLKKNILNKEIASVQIKLDKIIHQNKKSFINNTKKAVIKDIQRQGKYFIFSLSNGYYLLIHLRMSGQILYLPHEAPVAKHTHVIISFKNSGYELRFKDVRQFGYMLTLDKGELKNYLAGRIGDDILQVSLPQFEKALKTRKRIIKSLLLDQKIFSGIGNIYANEALFAAGINPQAISSNLSKKEIDKLYQALMGVLKLAVKLGGSSIGDYILPDNSIGSFQKRHKIYQKQGHPCPVCHTPIKRMKQNGRSTWYCPKCQDVGS